MPLYDYECQTCGRVQEEFRAYEEREVLCNSCGKTSKRIVSGGSIDVFKAEHYEELGDDAPYITSKEHLARECRARGIYSRRLLESYTQHNERREL